MKKLSFTRREALTGWLYAALPLSGFLVFFFVPFVLSIIRSFQKGIAQEFAGLENYVSVLQSTAFQTAGINTLRFMLLAVPLNIIIGLCIALALNKLAKNASVFRTIFLVPYVIPVASTVMVFQVLFERSGLVNTLLGLLDLKMVDFLHSDKAFYILLLLYIWKNFGYNMVLFLSGLALIPPEYAEAARVDGAGRWRTLWLVTFPLLGPTFFFVSVISIVNSFKVFREAYALGGGYPHESIYMLQHFMNNNLQNLNYQRLSVASMYVFAVIVLLVFVLYHHRRRRGDIQL